MSKKPTSNMVREIAQRLADIEFGDHGTLGGNADCADLVDFVHKLRGADRILFTDYYLGELRLRLLSDDFDTTTRYKKESPARFNPRL